MQSRLAGHSRNPLGHQPRNINHYFFLLTEVQRKADKATEEDS